MTSERDPRGGPTRATAPAAGRSRGGAARPWREDRDDDLDRGHVDRIAGVYMVAAGLWIALSGPIVAWFADRASLPVAGLEIAKGLVFVLATGLVLRAALRRWAARVEAAAVREHEAAERLREAEELRSAFLNGVSHQLRTPLTSIVGYGETLQRLCRERHAAELEQLADRLVTNADRLRGLILDLLDTDALLRGIGHLQLRRTDIGNLITAVTADQDIGSRRLLLEGGPVEADVDSSKLERIIELLLDNAVKHTPPSAQLLFRWEQHGDDVRIIVEDDGPGLGDEIRPTVFEPFVQGYAASQSPNPGVGIGLTLVDQYVRLHHGTATAENAASGGTRIALTFPATQPEPVVRLEDEPAGARPSRRVAHSGSAAR